MSEDDESKPPEDDDRALILARRQRFIALALSGLTTACTAKPAEPQACLDMPPDPETRAPPHPCLSEVQPPPQACLEVVEPASETGETETGETETGETETGEVEPKPRVCLSKIPPQPHRSPEQQTPPEPCLKTAGPPLE